MERSAERALWVIVASATLTVMAGAILGPITNEIRIARDVSPSFAGLIITTHGLFIVLCSPFVGALIDRIGPRLLRQRSVPLRARERGGAGDRVVRSPPDLACGTGGRSRTELHLDHGVDLQSLRRLAKGWVMGLRGSVNSVGAAVWPLLGGALGTLAWQLPFGIYLLGLPLGILAAFTVPDVSPASDEGPADERSVTGILRSTPLLIAVYGLIVLTNLLLYANVVYYPPSWRGSASRHHS